MHIQIDDIPEEDEAGKVRAGTTFCAVTIEENPTTVLITAYSQKSRLFLTVYADGTMNVVEDDDWQGLVFDKEEPALSLAAKAGF